MSDGSAADLVEETTAERVLPEAAKLFRERGYAASSTRELAARLGLHKASLYYHVERKEDLLFKICEESLNSVIAAAASAIELERDPLRRLNALITAHIVTMTSEIDMHATMLLELRSLSAERRDEVLLLRHSYETMVEASIRDGQTTRQIRDDIDSRTLTLLLFNILNWSITWYRPDRGITPTELAHLTTAVFVDGSAGPKRRASLSDQTSPEPIPDTASSE